MRRFLSKKWMLWTGAAAAVVFVVLFAAAAYVLRGPMLRQRAEGALADALNCDVTIDSLTVHLLPRIEVAGTGLSIRIRNRPDLPAFVSAEKFLVHPGIVQVLRRSVDTVHLDGLIINVPRHARHVGIGDSADDDDARTNAPAGSSPAPRHPFHVDHILTHNAVLNFVARTTGKAGGHRPLAFDIPDLEIGDAGITDPMKFTATVFNPIPEGTVHVTGAFGPWNRDEPSDTALAGDYDLTDADMGTINGLGGKLSSTGHFTGELDEIRVTGTSEMKDFSLDLGGNPVPLSTSFVVTVDGTDGTTILEHVDAKLANTTAVVSGAITNLPGPKNHDLDLSVKVDNGRVEDILKLVFEADLPMMTGEVSLDATVKLPPGPGRAGQRISSKGTFVLGNGKFTDPGVQDHLRDLSRRGQGKDEDEAMRGVATDLNGAYSLDRGLVTLSRITFEVPGAAIRLKGSYDMRSEDIDFLGEARLQASLSKAVGGVKSIFIKPFNPLFRKDGAGAVIPIKITGTKEAPKFGIRLGAVFGKGEK